MSFIYEEITNKVIEELEKGVVPWRKTWAGPEMAPRNLTSGRAYTGINSFLLSWSNFSSPYWLTWHQIKNLGGRVKPGSKSRQIIFWKAIEKNLSAINSGSGMGEEKMETVLVLRFYNVFSIEQCTGIEIPEKEKPIEREFTPIEAAEKIIIDMKNRPKIEHIGNQAYYDPILDKVVLPRKEHFESEAAYYATMNHELIHSSGSSKRLNRSEVTDITHFGSDAYSREELVAEMGSTFLCSHAGIENEVMPNSVAYIQGWLKKLRKDKKMVVMAAARASKAADHILGKL